MNSSEFKSIREAMGLSVREYAEAFSLGETTVCHDSGIFVSKRFNAIAIRCIYALWKIDPHHDEIPIQARGVKQGNRRI